MNVIIVLAIILFVLMTAVGGRKGIRSFLSLFLNFGVIFFTLAFMLDPGMNPVYLTFAASALIGCISLFFINEVNRKTVIAFVSTMLTVAVMMALISAAADMLMIQGFGEEETEAISGFSLLIGIDYLKVGVSVVILSTVGAVMDVAISISSAMHEMYKHDPALQKSELFAGGMKVGRDILSTDTNTLFFAFFGGYLALLIWFKDLQYSIGEIINSKIFSSEMLLIFCAGTGIALVIPVTSMITAYFLARQKEQHAEPE